MTLYDYLIQTVQRTARSKGAEYRRIDIDLHSQSIWCDREPILCHGILVTCQVSDSEGHVIVDDLIHYEGEPYAEIQRLYAQYKRSVPRKRDKGRNRGCFKALPADDLSMVELENNMSRDEARIRLEAFICLGAASGLIHWRVPRHFFWQGQDPNCIIYRSWIIPDDEFKEDIQYEEQSTSA